jgi:hypothetical protein
MKAWSKDNTDSQSAYSEKSENTAPDKKSEPFSPEKKSTDREVFDSFFLTDHPWEDREE